jgi:hypothetical protein
MNQLSLPIRVSLNQPHVTDATIVPYYVWTGSGPDRTFLCGVINNFEMEVKSKDGVFPESNFTKLERELADYPHITAN